MDVYKSDEFRMNSMKVRFESQTVSLFEFCCFLLTDVYADVSKASRERTRGCFVLDSKGACTDALILHPADCTVF